MAKFRTIQESFAAGEISPLLHGRVTIEGYRSGCKELVNFRPDARGPAVSRLGTKFIAESEDNDGRLFSISIENSEFYVGLLTDLRMRLFTADGSPVSMNVIQEPNFSNGGAAWSETVTTNSSVVYGDHDAKITANTIGAELVTNPSFVNLGTGWTERNDGASTVAFFVGEARLTPDQGGGPNPRFAGIAQQVTIASPGLLHSVNITGDFTSGAVRVRAGLTNGSDEFLNQIIAIDSILDFTPTADAWISIDCEKPEVQASISSVNLLDVGAGSARIFQNITGLSSGSHTLHVDLNQGAEINVRVGTGENDGTYYNVLHTGKELTATFNIPTNSATLTIHVDSTNVASINRISLTDPLSDFDVVTPWPEAVVHELHHVSLPDNSELHIMHKNYPPQRLNYNPVTDVFSFDPVPTVNFPSQWTGTSWPRTGTFLWGRLWYGGPPNSPNQFWGSRSNSFTDFIVPNSGAVASDPVTYTLQKFGSIQWMEGTKALLIGSLYAEYVVKSDSRFTDVTEVPDIQQQSAYGSGSVQPIQVGDQVFYVSSDDRKLRALQYEWSADNWLSNDITFFSEHITESGIKDIGWQQNPNNVLWATLNNGTIATLTYQRDQNVWGWSLIEATKPFTSATSAQLLGSHFFVGLIKRGNKINLVYQALHSSGYLDLYVDKDDAVPFTTVENLEHLEGETVQVLVDDPDNPRKSTDPLGVHPDRVVVGGQITLQAPATDAIVGMKYVPRLVTLDLESFGRDGSSLTKIKHYSDIYVGVLDTYGITINGKRPPDRASETPMNSREKNITSNIKVVDTGWRRSGSITIEQELPLPATITFISGKVAIEDA